MKGFEVFEPVALPYSNIRLGIASGVIGERKEVSLTRESHKTDRANEVDIYKLVCLLCSPLRFSIVHRDSFGSLAAITDISF